MSENKLLGSLVLRTIDITPTTIAPCISQLVAIDNDLGTCSANGGYIVWKNVNIRTCLGELYNKYNRFNLKLTAAGIRHNGVTDLTDAQFIILMSGLPFSSGSTYSTRLGPTNQAVLGCVDFLLSTTGKLGITTPLLCGLVSFDKPLQDVINIAVELKNSSTTTITMSNYDNATFREKTVGLLGHWFIICDIYGIED
jgi:hypothetical protein